MPKYQYARLITSRISLRVIWEGSHHEVPQTPPDEIKLVSSDRVWVMNEPGNWLTQRNSSITLSLSEAEALVRELNKYIKRGSTDEKG